MPKPLIAKKVVGRPRGALKARNPQNIFTDKLLSDMRRYFWATDWRELWEDWYLGVDESGRPKYRTIRQFIVKRAESAKQKQFLTWYLGPRPEPGDKDLGEFMYPFTKSGPQDWAKKRSEGGWMASENMRDGLAEIRRTTHILQKVQAVGDKVHLQMVLKWQRVIEQIEKGVREIFLPDLGFKENFSRTREVIDILKEAQGGLQSATDAYMKSQGVNLDDLQGLVMLLASPALAANTALLQGKEPTQEQVAAQALVKMVMAKAQRYELPLPKAMEATIIDAVSEDVEPVVDKKKGVN